MNNTIDIRIGIDDKHILDVIYSALEVEQKASETKRGRMNVTREEKALSIHIEADDLVAARALSNSILRLAKTSADIISNL